MADSARMVGVMMEQGGMRNMMCGRSLGSGARGGRRRI